MELFDYISKGFHRMLLNLGLKGDLMVLDMCLKFGVQEKSGSPDTGSKGVQNGVFRELFVKYASDFNYYRAGRNYYCT